MLSALRLDRPLRQMARHEHFGSEHQALPHRKGLPP